jgi:hypothetical protein
MDNNSLAETYKEFIAYVFEQRRQGVSDSQIARKLGMSLTHFLGRLNTAEKELEKPAANPDNIPKKSENGVKPVSGFSDAGTVVPPFPGSEQREKSKNHKMKNEKKQPEKTEEEEDLSWMN